MRVSEKRMAEIKILKYLPRFLRFRHVFYVLLILLSSVFTSAQQPAKTQKGVKKIEVLNADFLKNSPFDPDLQRLIDNVILKHKEVTMYCDSAHYFKKKNQVKAYGKVHIEQGDTLDLYGDYLFYDGESGRAIVTGKVELIDKETHLFTKEIDYDTKNKIAKYDKHGRITNSDNVLTSIIGVYYVSDNLFHFKDSVKIVNPDYVMKADTMDYNTQSEIAFFTGPTELKGDSLDLYCEKGWYDTKKEETSIWRNAMIDNKSQIIHGDSLFFSDSTGFGQSFGNVTIEDTTNNLIVQGEYAWYYKEPEQFMVTDKAVFIQVSGADSLFLHADTISAVTVADTSLKGYRLMRANYNVRIFSKDLQAKCDSLSYSFRDSVIRFYRDPVIWSEENQLTADSMAIFTKNRKTERLELYSSAFVTSQIDSLRFNQTKGRSLTGYFKDNELYKINIKGNGESVYYLLEGEDIAGINSSKCADTEILVENGKILEVTDYGTPEGEINPPEIGKPVPVRLKGFNWFDLIRPKKKSDIFEK
jgi:lipopolysaccharide export system protein LptA